MKQEANFCSIPRLVGSVFRWGKVTAIWFVALSHNTPKILVSFHLILSCDFAYVSRSSASLSSSSFMLECHLCSLKLSFPKILIIVWISGMLFPSEMTSSTYKLLSISSTSIGYLSLQPPRWTVRVPPKMNGDWTSPNNALVNRYYSIWFGSLSTNQWKRIAFRSSSLISTCRKAWFTRDLLLIHSLIYSWLRQHVHLITCDF